MKKGQTLIALDGLEVALYPLESIRITQTHYGTTSHASNKVKNTGLFDVTGCSGDANKGVIFAPFTCKVVAIQKGKSNGNQTLVQSVNKVHLANGEIDYARFGFGHDNVLDIKLGQVIRQGEKLGDCGNYGNVTGVHSHFLLGTGEWTRGNSIPTIENKNGSNIFYMPNAIDIDDMFYAEGINRIAKVINSVKSSTKSYDTVTENSDGTITQVTYCDATSAKPNFKVTNTWRKWTGDTLDLTKFIVDRDETKHQVELTKEIIRARKATTLDDSSYLGLKMPVGIYNVVEIVNANNYDWVKITDGLYFALTGDCYIDYPADDTDYKNKYEEEVKKYDTLKNQYDSLNNKLTSLNDEYSKLQDEYNTLNNSYNNLTNANTELTEKIEKIKEILG